MATATYGQITVVGTAADLAVAARAYANQRKLKPLGEYLAKPFRIEFHAAPEFVALGAILPGSIDKANPKGLAPWGHVMAHGELWVNRDEPIAHQVYGCRHEPVHPLIAALMTAAKRAKLLPLVQRVKSKNPYRNRLSEVLCDAVVELFWGRSPLDSYYGDISDEELQHAFDVLIGASTDPIVPVEPPIPLPLPDPRDVQIASLVAQLAAKNDALLAANSSLASARGSTKGAFLAMHRLEDQLQSAQAKARDALAVVGTVIELTDLPTDLPADPELENPVQD